MWNLKLVHFGEQVARAWVVLSMASLATYGQILVLAFILDWIARELP